MNEKDDYMFAILIPAHNCVDYLKGCLDSILAQTFEHYQIVLFDDKSTDGTNMVCRDYAMYHPDKIKGIENWGERKWNGGARNYLMKHCPNAHYVFFMDGDDKLVSDDVLQRISDFIIEQNSPDVVRLPYNKKKPDGVINKQISDFSPAEMAASARVAPWTKVVKKKFLEETPFPENTLFEDVIQHLMLADKVESVASVDFPVVEWNRCNPHSVSTAITSKRKSSAFRFVADLMDLELEKPYTQARRDVKVRDAANNLGVDFDKIDWAKVCC